MKKLMILAVAVLSTGCAFKKSDNTQNQQAITQSIPTSRMSCDYFQYSGNPDQIKTISFEKMDDGSLKAVSAVVLPEILPTDGFQFKIITTQSTHSITSKLLVTEIELVAIHATDSGTIVDLKIESLENVRFKNLKKGKPSLVSIIIGDLTYKIEFRKQPEDVSVTFRKTDVTAAGINILSSGASYVKVGEIDFGFQSIDQKLVLPRHETTGLISQFTHIDYENNIKSSTPYDTDISAPTNVVQKIIKKEFQSTSESNYIFVLQTESLQAFDGSEKDRDSRFSIFPDGKLSATILVFAKSSNTAFEFTRVGTSCKSYKIHNFPESWDYICTQGNESNGHCYRQYSFQTPTWYFVSKAPKTTLNRLMLAALVRIYLTILRELFLHIPTSMRT